MLTKNLEEKSLRKLILALNEGLSVYGGLNKNYVPIKMSFSQCTYMTAMTAIGELVAYVSDLDCDICQEPLCLDFDEMGREDYWMEKLAKLRSDMTELEELPLLQRDLVWGYKGFFPKSTAEFYQGVEEKVLEVARQIRLVQQKIAEKPLSFYNKFYHDQRAQYCEDQAVKDFNHWLTHSGIITPVKLRMLRAEKIADFINSGILRLALGSCGIEQGDMDVEQFKQQLPLDYEYAESFDALCPIFNRTIGWQGDILVPNYDCAGLFIFQHWDELTQTDIHAIFYLDKMLELIHDELIQQQPVQTDDETAELNGLPSPLATPEAMILWQKAIDAGWVDEHYQPLLSRTQAALLADAIAERLGIRDKWKVFEAFWNRKNMRNDYNDALNQRQTGEFLNTLKDRIF